MADVLRFPRQVSALSKPHRTGRSRLIFTCRFEKSAGGSIGRETHNPYDHQLSNQLRRYHVQRQIDIVQLTHLDLRLTLLCPFSLALHLSTISHSNVRNLLLERTYAPTHHSLLEYERNCSKPHSAIQSIYLSATRSAGVCGVMTTYRDVPLVQLDTVLFSFLLNSFL